jgi:succinate dehydrogenase / fumarate reductase cytochrome b subunit
MTRKFCFFSSTVGMKYLMGLSGLIWVGFVMAHMLGNLLLFIGPDAYNEYSHLLTSGKLIYVAEGALIFSLLTHVVMGIRLTIKNKVAKGSRYHVQAAGEKKVSWSSRTMIFHGAIILFFVVYHLITFKFGPYYETTYNGVVMRDIHRLVVEVFSDPMYVLGYIFCLLILTAHLSHGVGSLVQSFGLNSRAHEKTVKRLSLAYALVVGGGFILQPIYVYFIN